MKKSLTTLQAYKKTPAKSLKPSYKVFFNSLEGIDVKPFTACLNQELEILSIEHEKTLPKHFPKFVIRVLYQNQVLALRVSPDYLFCMYV